jgi:Uma2 family endonuclease
MALHPLTVDDYHRMIEVGVLTEDHRVELLDGAIIDMSPEGPDHAAVIDRLVRFFARCLDDSLIVRCQHPLTFQPVSEPEPDVAVVDLAASNWRSHPDSAYLVIEVAKTSLRKDRADKARIYATHGIPEYWVIDLRRLCAYVHLDPRGDGYGEVHTVEPPAALRPTAVVTPELPLGDLFV